MSVPKSLQDPRLVISVGQCGYDNSRIAALVRSIDPAIGFETTDTANETLDLLRDSGERTALALVNRIFDADGDCGVEFVKKMKRPDAEFAEIPVMLVSNFEQSQAEAIANGALPGFGKAQLQSGETRARLEAVLTGKQSQS